MGVKVPVGESRTVTLRLFSDRATGGKWKVSLNKASDPRFTYALDRATGENGEKIHLTITGLPNSEQTEAGTSPLGRVVVWSELGSQYAAWPFSIAN